MDQDEHYLRQAIAEAKHAREAGNHPFGAVLVDSEGLIIAAAGNTVVSEHDPTQHAESNVIRAAAALGADLKSATLYASTEPCMMCCGAIHWAGIPRVVYGCAASTLAEIVGSSDFLAPCREIFLKSNEPRVEVAGPLLEDEAIAVHRGFWR